MQAVGLPTFARRIGVTQCAPLARPAGRDANNSAVSPPPPRRTARRIGPPASAR